MSPAPFQTSTNTIDEFLPKLEHYLIATLRPAIREMLEVQNPELFLKWGRNCCIQTSLIVNHYLREALMSPGNTSGYTDIQSWHAVMHDTIQDKHVNYNHAWVYCVNKDPKKNLLIDIARKDRPNIVVFSERNEYPQDNPYFKAIRFRGMEHLDFDAHFKEEEYFTSKKLPQIIKELNAYLADQETIPFTELREGEEILELEEELV